MRGLVVLLAAAALLGCPASAWSCPPAAPQPDAVDAYAPAPDLDKTGYTVADLKYRVKLEMLTIRIRVQVVRGHHTAASKQQALAKFTNEFTTKWRARTWCRAEYANERCAAQ